MQTGYSIFGGSVETMDGPVRAVSIMPRFIKPGAFAADTPTAVAYPTHTFGPIRRAVPPTRIAAPSPTGQRPGSVAYPGVPRAGGGPHGFTPHHAAPLPAHPQYPGSTVPAHPQYPGRPMPSPGGTPPGIMVPGPGGTPPGMMVPGPVPTPRQPWQRPHSHHMTPTPRGPVPTPCTCPPVPACAPCGGAPMPLTGPIQYYNPTPSAPISPAAGYCPLPGCGPMTDGCGHVLDAQGATMYHPGGSYPITQHGPGLNDGLTRKQILHGQLPVGAGTDIFGGTVNAEDPMTSQPIGPACAGGGGSQAQPQAAYNHFHPCGGHVPGTGGGAGVFGARSGVFGAGPDGLGRY